MVAFKSTRSNIQWQDVAAIGEAIRAPPFPPSRVEDDQVLVASPSNPT